MGEVEKTLVFQLVAGQFEGGIGWLASIHR